MRMNNLWAKACCLLLAGAVCAGLAACSDDHNDEPRPEGLEEIVTHIESVVNSHLDELYGNETLDELLLPVENDHEAQEVVKEFIREEWNGQDYTYRVPGDYGHIRIRKDSQEGLYYTMVFSINDHKPFTFRLCTPGYPESENAPQGLQHVSGSWQLGDTELATDTSEWTESSSENVASKDLLARYDGTETEAKMGDYYYSDGTWSDGGLRILYADGKVKYIQTMPLPEKTVIGIVFYAGKHPNDGSDYYCYKFLDKDGSLWLHFKVRGYVVALTDVHNGDSDRLRWECKDGTYNRRAGASTDENAWNGYTNCQQIHKFVADNSSDGWEMKHFPAAFACETYGNRTTDEDGNDADGKYDWQKPLVAPDYTSGWFLPSCGQLKHIWQHRDFLSNNINIVKENFGDSALTEHIKSFSSPYYWSSTEFSNDPAFAWYVVFYDGLCHGSNKGAYRNVRPILVF